jgi:DNA-binding CsgD family transcriptional regulator
MIRTLTHPALRTRDWLRLSRTLGLSPQQLVILKLIVLELDPTNDAIALALGISRRSVEKQLQRMYAKLGVGSKAGLVSRVLWEVARMREGEVHHRSKIRRGEGQTDAGKST